MTSSFDWAPVALRPFVHAAIAAVAHDPRVLGLVAGGSAATKTMDEYSDLDLVVVCRDDSHAQVMAAAPEFAARLGPLLASFTGEHVGEPRLLINLYGPPPVHVDLKFVSDNQLDDRVENGLILWQRDDTLSAALRRAEAVWPNPDPQWIEDRFWTWVHYAASKIGRGELFECLDVLAYLRRVVLGPLIVLGRGHRPAGVRRVETIAPDVAPALAATVSGLDRRDCVRALQATVDLYRALRPESQGLVWRTAAESASRDFLAGIAAITTPRDESSSDSTSASEAPST